MVAAIPHVQKEIIVVDDCSTDGTTGRLRQLIGNKIRKATIGSGGPGAGIAIGGDPRIIPPAQQREGGCPALGTGISAATGDVLVIQDADLEYDPTDWERCWPLFTENVADVVYGSRFYGRPHRSLYYHHYMGNRLISFLFSVLYNQILTDLEVCYKMFTRSVLPLLTPRCNDFECEIEFSSSIARVRNLRIYEVGISYYGHTYAEGKK